MLTRDYVAFDVETTGLDSRYDEIIEIGLVRISRGEIVEKAEWLVNPGFSISSEITALTGITNEMLHNRPTFSEIVTEVENFIMGADLIAHNIKFDLGFLIKYCQVGGGLEFDTLELAKIIIPGATNYTLENLVSELSINRGSFHRAGYDAEVTAHLFLKLYEIATRAQLDVLTNTVKLFTEGSPLRRFFDGALKERVKSSIIGEQRNFLQQLRLTQIPTREIDENYKLNEKEITAWYGEDSPLSKGLNFEKRQPQIEMAKAIIQSFNEGRHAVIEAGTGTGKSLAYLLPAAKFTLHTGKKVAIATNTISLQEQLINKDIPLLKVLGLNIKTALIKGRSNYICLKKFFAMDDYSDLKDEERLILAKLYFWISQTITGDKSELNIRPRFLYFWHNFSSDSDSCMGSKCKWYARQCFFWHARRQAELADLLIINHALLLSDCSAEKKILPEFSSLIIDEAHHLEKMAGEYLGEEADIIELGYVLNKLIAANKNEGVSVLGKIRKQLLSFMEYEEVYAKRLLNLIEETYQIQGQLRIKIDDLQEHLLNNLPLSKTDNLDFTSTFRIKIDHFLIPSWKNIFEKGQQLAIQLSELVRYLNRFLNELETIPSEIAEKELWQFEINNILQFLKKCASTLAIFFTEDVSEEIKWLEYDNELKNRLVCKYVPFDVGLILKDALYSTCETIIFTSATLTINRRFDYFLENIGLGSIEGKVETLQVGSPFDYDKQALVIVPSDAINPQIHEIKFLQSTIDFLQNIYQEYKGRTLVLFTSHKHLRYVYENLELPSDVSVLAQNISGQREKILKSFCNQQNACLLGANTFWEGIDLPGELLNLLIIVKLPFMPPNYPLLEAKVEKAEQEGHNAFSKITLPGAVIRFKQGFGRLIRRTSDKGVVVILDGRINSKKYGITFLKSLPIKSYFTSTQHEVISKVVDWLRN